MPIIGRYFVAMLKRLGIDRKFGLRVPDDKVGAHTRGNLAFLPAKTGEFGGFCAHPPAQVIERMPALTRRAPHNRQRELKRGNATPGLVEAPRVETFQRRRTR